MLVFFRCMLAVCNSPMLTSLTQACLCAASPSRRRSNSRNTSTSIARYHHTKSCPEIDPLLVRPVRCNLFFLHKQNLFGVKRVPGIAYNMCAPSLQP